MLKFIVVAPSDGLAAWQKSCIDALAAAGLAHLEAVWTLSTPGRSRSAIWTAYAAWTRSRLPELKVFADSPAGAGLPEPVEAPALCDRTTVDFVLWFGSNTGVGLGTSPRYGIWELRIGGHPPDELAAIGETAQRSGYFRVEILARGGRYEGGGTLKAANLKTRRTHLRTLQKAFRAAPQILVQACRGALSEQPPVRPAAPEPTSVLPRFSTFLLAQFRRSVSGALRRLLIRDEWAIGVVEMPSVRLLEGGQLTEPSWIAVPDAREFFADPFLVEADNRMYVMCEVYDETSARGWIGTLALDEANRPCAPMEPAIRMDCHMSYPHTFEHEGSTYCAPEVSEHGGLLLFRRTPGTMQWERLAVQLENVPLIDPTLFAHRGTWWLLGTLAGPASDTDLYAWHAPSPFGPWKEHALNPVQSDVRCSRPAGSVFTIDGRLYRPAQDCAEGYGRSLVIQEILQLDEQRFEEATRSHILPASDWEYPDGIHTINIGRGLLVVDAKRERIQPSMPVRKLLHMLRHAARRRQEASL